MRVGLVVLLVAAALGLGQAAAADTFPDLPGMGLAESVTGGASAPSENATTVEAKSTSDDRVPAPDPSEATTDDARTVVAEATTPEEAAVVSELPGGASIPLISEVAPVSSGAAAVAVLAMLALAVVVGWTRFLVRLNHI